MNTTPKYIAFATLALATSVAFGQTSQPAAGDMPVAAPKLQRMAPAPAAALPSQQVMVDTHAPASVARAAAQPAVAASKASRSTRAVRAKPTTVTDVITAPKKVDPVMAAYKNWVDSSEVRFRVTADGVVRYSFSGPPPVIVCGVMRTCAIELEPGEELQNWLAPGDGASAKDDAGGNGMFTLDVFYRTSDAAPVIAFTPKFPDVQTNLLVYSNRRTYSLFLRTAGPNEDFIPRVGFLYDKPTSGLGKLPPAPAQVVREQAAAVVAEKVAAVARKPETLLDTVNKAVKPVSSYAIKGEASFKPVKVFNDGSKTFIELPSAAKNVEGVKPVEMPALFEVTKGGQYSVPPYRIRNGHISVDKVPDRMVLVLGTGRNVEKVEIILEAATPEGEK